MLKLIGVSKSAYYQFKKHIPSKQSIRKKEMKQEIIKVYNESKQIYGAPKITQVLKSNGHHISQKTVSQYMKEEGLKAIWVTRYVRTTIDPNFDNKLKNILNREFTPSRPNAVWVTDITYIDTLEGFVYLTSIMDLYSRKIISWHLSETLETEGVLSALKKAKATRKMDSPIIIHSDRGCQYVSKAYVAETPADTFIRSYSHKGTPWDNACIESFHALIKREWLNRYIIKNIQDAHALVFEYIDTFYNTKRIHSHCDYRSPYDFEAQQAV